MTPTSPSIPGALTTAEVHKVARLSRLALTDQQVELYRGQLTAVLLYTNRLRDVDLAGVEPMPHVGEEVNHLDEDVPGPTLDNAALMGMAPDQMAPFVKVPRVFGDEGGA